MIALAPSLFSAASAVAGSALNAASNSSANSKNMAINQMNNEFNAREAEKARAFQLDMWNRENAYNTPLKQRQRFAEAGLNPYLMMDGSSAGNASGIGSTSQASASQPLQVYPMDYSSLTSALARAAQMSYEATQSNAVTENLQSQKDVNQAQAQQIFSNIDWGKLSPDYRKWLRDTGIQRAHCSRESH